MADTEAIQDIWVLGAQRDAFGITRVADGDRNKLPRVGNERLFDNEPIIEDAADNQDRSSGEEGGLGKDDLDGGNNQGGVDGKAVLRGKGWLPNCR